jgi:hypothetical protein
VSLFFSFSDLLYLASICYGPARIIYKNWLLKTSVAHSVTIENWPSDLPYNPKYIKMSRLHELLDGLHNKTIYYRKMTPQEHSQALEKANARA